MSNDSIREVFRDKYPYENGLDIPKQLVLEDEHEGGQWSFVGDFIEWLSGIFEDFIVFLTRLPMAVWIICGIVLAAILFVWIYRSGLFLRHRKLDEIPLTDDIYKIDFDPELSAALETGDYAEALRIRYLRTLKLLVDNGRVAWRIYKTPTQFANEAADKSFSKMTRHFLWVRYGKYPASESLYRQIEDLAEQVEKGGAK